MFCWKNHYDFSLGLLNTCNNEFELVLTTLATQLVPTTLQIKSSNTYNDGFELVSTILTTMGFELVSTALSVMGFDILQKTYNFAAIGVNLINLMPTTLAKNGFELMQTLLHL